MIPPTESAPDSERQRLIAAVAQDAADFLGLNAQQDPPAKIVKAVNETIVKIVFGETVPIPEGEEPALLLGCLWGNQMVRELQWSWANIQLAESEDVAIVSPSRDMAIYPFTFVGACIEKRCICTVELAFNMLVEREGEAVYEPGSYEDVMQHIHHIVPPYTLEPQQ